MNTDTKCASFIMPADADGKLMHPHAHVFESPQKKYVRPYDNVFSGLDGWKCVGHPKNDGVNCPACEYALMMGGINEEWCKNNHGAHTQSIPVPVPESIVARSQLGKASAWHNQVAGSHYKAQGIQPMQYAMANNLSALEFSIVKYLRHKGDKAKRLEDLRKLIHCAEMLLEWEENDGKI